MVMREAAITRDTSPTLIIKDEMRHVKKSGQNKSKNQSRSCEMIGCSPEKAVTRFLPPSFDL